MSGMSISFLFVMPDMVIKEPTEIMQWSSVMLRMTGCIGRCVWRARSGLRCITGVSVDVKISAGLLTMRRRCSRTIRVLDGCSGSEG